ncbi:MAG TPA: nitrilase-related carbon-nitrogen hydrolase [Acidimicrobiia bacterium]|nr:nitrilase-related carbon-nitrogen hydrolase [Acidimicrobiia bacterium]
MVRTAFDILRSPARVHRPTRALVRIGVVQMIWNPDPDAHDASLTQGIHLAAREGARLVCLPELTRSRYFAVERRDAERPQAYPEALPGGPTFDLAAGAARREGVYVHASCYEDAGDGGLGFNTAFVVSPEGTLVACRRKTHLPVTAGYYEDTWFRPGDSGWPVTRLADLGGAAFGFPTCWDQWFPETSRAFALGGADVLVYPTAIGSEPDHPEFDTEPLWQQVVSAQGIMNGTFMIAVNRAGVEGPLTFYGSSFVSDPYGRVLVQAPRSEPAVLVADLDLDQRRDWLDLFPLLATRRPETYGPLTGSDS